MGDDLEQKPAVVCPECGEETTVKRTVPWQPDICTACGADVDD